MKLPTVYDGNWVRPVRRGYLLQCCDCGLVHRLNLRLVPRKGGGHFIEFQPFRVTRKRKRKP